MKHQGGKAVLFLRDDSSVCAIWPIPLSATDWSDTPRCQLISLRHRCGIGDRGNDGRNSSLTHAAGCGVFEVPRNIALVTYWNWLSLFQSRYIQNYFCGWNAPWLLLF